MKEEALQINPDCKIEIFDTGINPDNIDDFLKGVDLCVDALDIFVPHARRLFFNESHKKKIPVITA
jgi:tRNA A37 threonylcarbamoyladenosine dehydratase